MAAKHKQRRKTDANKRTFVRPEDAEMEEEEEEATYGGKRNATKKEEEEELSLDEVLRLGGTQADYILLAGLEDSGDLVDGGTKDAIDDLEQGELEQFITRLGLGAYADQQIVEQQTKQTKTQGAQGTAGKKAKLSANVFEFQQRPVLLVKPGGKWYDLEYTAEGSSAPQDPAMVSQYKTLAQQLLEADVSLYKNKKNLQKGANSAWMKTVVSSGVLADRMAAMTVLIQDAPVHMLEHVESLVSMVKKKGSRRMGLMALDTLRELLLSDLLPEGRKLRPFAQHPFHQLEDVASGNRDARDRRLILWYFEHQLKHHVAEFVAALDVVAHDTVAATKTKALTTAHELLSQRPEQERALLAQLVNKLGDPEYKMAAKASYLLETLLHKHPNMKAVVCCEVERLVFRPNVAPKAQYYAVCFLSQVRLSHDEAQLAAKLITIYFSFFRACVKKKDVESKMLSALLSGVNRAYPYAGAGDDKVKEQLDTLFRVVHLVKFNTAVQALMLLFQVMDAQQSVSDRYYVALYRKLQDSGLSSSSRQTMFLNLLYKSLKADVMLRRVKAFVKRLLQVSAEQSASFACGALFLVSEVMKAKPGLRTLLQEAEDGEEEEFKDLPEEDEDERFVDADKQTDAASAKSKPAASWVHHQNLGGGRSQQSYDPLHRNPLFCGAERSTLWELRRLALHFHPSVSLFANTLLQVTQGVCSEFQTCDLLIHVVCRPQGGAITYTGDPLQDFTLMRFLDRFVFRNPKQMKGKLNSEEFLSRDESQIPVNEIFFYRFFKKRQLDNTGRRQRRDADNESLEDVDDDEFEKLLDSYEGDSYYSNLPADPLDFAGNVKGKKGKKDADDSDSDDSDEGDLDDDEVSLGSMGEDFGDELEDEGGMFVDEDDRGAGKKQRKKTSAAFAAAEEVRPTARPIVAPLLPFKTRCSCVFQFGSMLDENAGSRFDSGGLNAMANKDRAGVFCLRLPAAAKQLRWETQRDDWIHGRDAKTLRRKKSTFKRRRPFAAGSRTLGNKKKRK
ncbi:unnamed protein product [Lampetra planeri]